jgi:hypothetical protein
MSKNIILVLIYHHHKLLEYKIKQPFVAGSNLGEQIHKTHKYWLSKKKKHVRPSHKEKPIHTEQSYLASTTCDNTMSQRN